MAAAWHIGIPRHTDAHWQRYEARLRQGDLLALTLDTEPATLEAVAQSEAATGESAEATATEQQGPQQQGAKPAPPPRPDTPPQDTRAQPRPPKRLPRRGGWVTKW